MVPDISLNILYTIPMGGANPASVLSVAGVVKEVVGKKDFCIPKGT